MERDYNTVIRDYKTLIRRSGLTISEIARRAHMSRSHLYLLMAGKVRPLVTTERRLLDAIVAGTRAKP